MLIRMFYIEIKAKAMQKYTFSSENCLLQLNMKFLSPFKGDCYEQNEYNTCCELSRRVGSLALRCNKWDVRARSLRGFGVSSTFPARKRHAVAMTCKAINSSMFRFFGSLPPSQTVVHFDYRAQKNDDRTLPRSQ